jgi:hypothetical protein
MRTISLSFTRETQTFKEIRLVLGYWVFVHDKRSHKLDVMYQRLSLPLTCFKLFLVMKILGCVHKPGTVKFIVFNVQSFACEKDTNQSTLDS